MKITIIGSGFAGAKAALELARDRHMKVHVITDRDTFQYYPTLYNTATGKSHLQSWTPLGEIFAGHDNIHVTIDPVIGIDAERRVITGVSETQYEYDTLLIAVGMVTTYFNIPGLDQYSYGIKSADQIRQLKERIYRDLTEDHHLDRNYVIVGAGPTGVELAGALGTYLKKLAEYHDLKPHRINIRLIEAADRVLPRSHPRISQKVHQRLEQLGVEVQTGTIVEKETAHHLIAGGRPIDTHTVIWTSGVMNNPLFAAHPEIFTLEKNGRVKVDKHLRAAPHIYVLGDNAATKYSGLAQTALHDALFVARNLIRQRKRQPLKEYKPAPPVSVVPIGRNWAALEWRGIRLYGRLAALLRRLGDYHGYSSYLPIGQALIPWRATEVEEYDYFAPEPQQVSNKPQHLRRTS